MSNLHLSKQLIQDEAKIPNFPIRGMTTHLTLESSIDKTRKSKKKKYDDDELLQILRYAERSSFEKAARKHGLSVTTLYNFRKRLEQLEIVVSPLDRLRAENEELRRILSERGVVIEHLKKLIEKL